MMTTKKLWKVIACATLLWATSAAAYDCKTNVTFDPTIWGGGPWAGFYIAHPANVVSNIVVYDGKGVPAPMQASFACTKTTYIEIHVTKLDSLTPVTSYKYWSRCFGMLPEYGDRVDLAINFPGLRDSTYPGNTTNYYRYDGAPDCMSKVSQ